MSSQTTKERKAKENLVGFRNGSTYDIEFDGCCHVEIGIRCGMCRVIHRQKSSKVPFIIYHDLECLLNESLDYHKSIKTNSAFNGNYIEYKSNGDRDKNLSPNKYIDMIKPYLSDIINDNKKCKIRLTMRINFISSKDLRETCTMHTRSDNIKIMMGSETNDITEELCESLQKY